MSHEEERATGGRMHWQPDSAIPHWLNPVLLGYMVKLLIVFITMFE
jgi:hypothetical protein